MIIKKTFIVLALVGLLAFAGLASRTVLATSSISQGLTNACNTNQSTKDNAYCQSKTNPGTQDTLSKTIGDVTTIAATIGGVVAVFFTIYGGFRYIVSNGDPAKTASARNTIFYALIGVVIIVAAETIILFIINNLG